jgi:hypothetical protein
MGLSAEFAPMDRFVARQNIDRCRSRLETDTDPARRAFLLKLLVQEEDKLGYTLELLDDVEREILKVRTQIDAFKVLIADLEHLGHSSRSDRGRLEAKSQVLDVYAQYRRNLLMELHLTRPSRPLSSIVSRAAE